MFFSNQLSYNTFKQLIKSERTPDKALSTAEVGSSRIRSEDQPLFSFMDHFRQESVKREKLLRFSYTLPRQMMAFHVR